MIRWGVSRVSSDPLRIEERIQLIHVQEPDLGEFKGSKKHLIPHSEADRKNFGGGEILN